MNQLPALRNDTVIVRLEAARTALSEAKTIQQSKTIADVAAAAEIYARRQKLGEEAIDFAHSVKIEALRLLGQIMAKTPKNSGSKGQLNGKDSSGGTRKVPPEIQAPTLAELGVDKKTSSMAQKLAALPEKEFEEVKEGHKSIGQAIASVDGTREKPSKPASDPAPEEFAPNLTDELDRADKEILRLQALVESLKKDDLAKEVEKWHLKFDQLHGRLQQCMTTKAEAEKSAQYQSDLLAKIRKALKVEKNTQILAALGK